MNTPIPATELESRIDSFMAKKDKQFPELQLQRDRSRSNPHDEDERNDAVWFKNLKPHVLNR